MHLNSIIILFIHMIINPNIQEKLITLLTKSLCKPNFLDFLDILRKRRSKVLHMYERL